MKDKQALLPKPAIILSDSHFYHTVSPGWYDRSTFVIRSFHTGETIIPQGWNDKILTRKRSLIHLFPLSLSGETNWWLMKSLRFLFINVKERLDMLSQIHVYGWSLYTCSLLSETMSVLWFLFQYRHGISGSLSFGFDPGDGAPQELSGRRNAGNDLFRWRNAVATFSWKPQ